MSAADHDSTLEPGTASNAFIIDAPLAVDEEGNTYRARARDTDAPILIREYLPEKWALRDPATLLVRPRNSSTEDFYEQGLVQFLRTARAWAQLHNPHLVRVTQYMEDAGTGYIVMEDFSGQPLNRLLPKWGGLLPPTEVMRLLEGLVDGLASVHAAQLVHGNIHPGSVVISDDGIPKLIEFSTALRDPTTTNATPVARLSPGYVPIEQYSVHSCLGTRTDIYALGATLYRCVTGLRPSDARERVAALSGGLDDPLLPAVQVADRKYDPALLRLIDQMLQPFDDARPDSVQSILQSLSSVAGLKEPVPVLKAPTGASSEPEVLEVPVAARRSIAPTRRSHRSRRIAPGPWIVASVVAAAGAVGLWWWYEADSRHASPTQADVAVDAAVVELQPDLLPAAGRDESFARHDDDARVDNYRQLYAEEKRRERQIEVDVAVQTRIDEIEAERQRVEQERQAAEAAATESEIRNLLHAAAQAAAEGRDVSPPGDNALESYRRVLQIDAEQVAAREGIANLLQRALERGSQAVVAGDLAAAETQLDRAIQIDPHDSGIRALRQAIIDVHTQQERRKWEAELSDTQSDREKRDDSQREAEVVRLISAAEQAEKAGRWITPPGDNALQYYRQALVLAPDDATVHAGLAELARRYFDTADASLAAARWDEAEAYATVGAAIDSENSRAASLFERIEAGRIPTEDGGSSSVAAVSAPAPTIIAAPKPPAPPNPATPAVESNGILQRALEAYYAGRYDIAFGNLKALAEQGSPRAQFRLALIYDAGYGVAKNSATAQQWVRRAAPQIRDAAASNQAWAQSDLGRMYQEGWLVQQNYAAAAEWYRRAAEQGDPGAQNDLALLYEQGLGVSRDRNKGVEWLRKAAGQGHLAARQNLQQLGIN
ncbi:MAG: protein kinase [Gammaproteobacteria bacterium]|nr:protein kinase [Gammaproteobacteria bacterium]